jgi:Transposase DDE domain
VTGIITLKEKQRFGGRDAVAENMRVIYVSRLWYHGAVWQRPALFTVLVEHAIPLCAGNMHTTGYATSVLYMAGRRRQTTEEFQRCYTQRAGVEGTLSQAVRAFGLRVARYRGLAKTRPLPSTSGASRTGSVMPARCPALLPIRSASGRRILKSSTVSPIGHYLPGSFKD